MTHPSTITTLAAMSFVSLMLIVGILVCDECRIERLTTFFFFYDSFGGSCFSILESVSWREAEKEPSSEVQFR